MAPTSAREKSESAVSRAHDDVVAFHLLRRNLSVFFFLQRRVDSTAFRLVQKPPGDSQAAAGQRRRRQRHGHVNFPCMRSSCVAQGHADKLCRQNETALYLTAKKNNIEIAKMLIEHGADVNQKSKCAFFQWRRAAAMRGRITVTP